MGGWRALDLGRHTLMAKVARRVVLAWLAGITGGAVVGVEAVAGPKSRKPKPTPTPTPSPTPTPTPIPGVYLAVYSDVY